MFWYRYVCFPEDVSIAYCFCVMNGRLMKVGFKRVLLLLSWKLHAIGFSQLQQFVLHSFMWSRKILFLENSSYLCGSSPSSYTFKLTSQQQPNKKELVAGSSKTQSLAPFWPNRWALREVKLERESEHSVDTFLSIVQCCLCCCKNVTQVIIYLELGNIQWENEKKTLQKSGFTFVQELFLRKYC